jgi:hypothetical protein
LEIYRLTLLEEFVMASRHVARFPGELNRIRHFRLGPAHLQHTGMVRSCRLARRLELAQLMASQHPQP